MNRKCQIFTPNDYVNRLLDIVNYTDCLYGKRVLENSCGVGNVLVVIVERYNISGLHVGCFNRSDKIAIVYRSAHRRAVNAKNRHKKNGYKDSQRSNNYECKSSVAKRP